MLRRSTQEKGERFDEGDHPSHRFGAGEHPTDVDPRNKEQNRTRRESTHHHSPSHITSTTKSGFSRMISSSGRIQLSSESSVGAVQPSAMHPHITAALWESVGKQIVKQSACGICAVPPITCAVAHAQVQTAWRMQGSAKAILRQTMFFAVFASSHLAWRIPRST